MNHDTQKLKKYLFGELSADETESFDELSFTDENFGADLNAAENDLIDAYINSDLSGADLKKFETVFLATQHRREKAEFARSLQKFAAKEIGKTETQTDKSGFFANWNIFTNRARQFGFAAAVLVLFTGIFWFAFFSGKKSRGEIALQNSPTPQTIAPENKTVEPENESANDENVSATNENQTSEIAENINDKTNRKISNANKKTIESNRKSEGENSSRKTENNSPKTIVATFFLAPPLRGAANKIPLFDVPKNASRIGVGLQLEANDFENYHVTLTNETGDINLWRGGSLKAKNKGDAKILNVNFPAGLLRNGFYSLTVSGINEAGEAEIVANYPFRVSEK